MARFAPMNAESASGAEDQGAERRFERPIQAWEWVFLLAFVVGIVTAAGWQSSKAYLSNDELVTAVVVSNPSFSQMMSAIRHGGELNPPLFFILEWLVARTCGLSEWALR